MSEVVFEEHGHWHCLLVDIGDQVLNFQLFESLGQRIVVLLLQSIRLENNSIIQGHVGLGRDINNATISLVQVELLHLVRSGLEFDIQGFHSIMHHFESHFFIQEALRLKVGIKVLPHFYESS